MTSWRRFAGAVLALTLGCRAAADSAAAGEFEADWVGADTGMLRATPRAVWCPAGRLLYLNAVRGDNGLGLVIYPADTLEPGAYPAFAPGADTVPRPSVAGSVRWFSQTALKGLRSDSGALTLERGGAPFSAAFEFRLVGAGGRDTVRLAGRFRGVRPESDSGSCPADSSAAEGTPIR